jgi:hypothetical protein
VHASLFWCAGGRGGYLRHPTVQIDYVCLRVDDIGTYRSTVYCVAFRLGAAAEKLSEPMHATYRRYTAVGQRPSPMSG